MTASHPPTPSVSLDILRSLRRIVRRVENASTELEAAHGVTAPQLLCLHALVREGHLTQVELSREVHLSASTLVGIIDRLESKGLVTRRRDSEDRRRIHIAPTPTGTEIERAAPEPLQLQLERGLERMSETERTTIAGALDRLVHLIEAQDIDAAPVLTAGTIPDATDKTLDSPAV